MDQPSLESVLADVNLPAVRYFRTIDSTNDEAWRWIESGAPHRALVISDEQSAGRGRLHRHWITTSGSGLAFSLVLLSPPLDPQPLSRLTGLGALAACLAIRKQYSLPAQVKWPNDILLDQHKAGGVLVETRWNGADLKAVVIGIGINIAPQSINPGILPFDELSFPATCVEDVLRHPVDRMELLHAILQELYSWLPRLGLPDFIDAWQGNLAFRDQWVELSGGDEALPPHQGRNQAQAMIGKLIGLNGDGSLQLMTRDGELVTAQVGELHLRPTAAPQPG